MGSIKSLTQISGPCRCPLQRDDDVHCTWRASLLRLQDARCWHHALCWHQLHHAGALCMCTVHRSTQMRRPHGTSRDRTASLNQDEARRPQAAARMAMGVSHDANSNIRTLRSAAGVCVLQSVDCCRDVERHGRDLGSCTVQAAHGLARRQGMAWANK